MREACQTSRSATCMHLLGVPDSLMSAIVLVGSHTLDNRRNPRSVGSRTLRIRGQIPGREVRYVPNSSSLPGWPTLRSSGQHNRKNVDVPSAALLHLAAGADPLLVPLSCRTANVAGFQPEMVTQDRSPSQQCQEGVVKEEGPHPSARRQRAKDWIGCRGPSTD